MKLHPVSNFQKKRVLLTLFKNAKTEIKYLITFIVTVQWQLLFGFPLIGFLCTTDPVLFKQMFWVYYSINVMYRCFQEIHVDSKYIVIQKERRLTLSQVHMLLHVSSFCVIFVQ